VIHAGEGMPGPAPTRRRVWRTARYLGRMTSRPSARAVAAWVSSLVSNRCTPKACIVARRNRSRVRQWPPCARGGRAALAVQLASRYTAIRTPGRAHYSERSRWSSSSVDTRAPRCFQNVRSQRLWAAGSKRARRPAARGLNGTRRATGTESRVTMISPAVASCLSASGHLRRMSRTDIRTTITWVTCFHAGGEDRRLLDDGRERTHSTRGSRTPRATSP
jgi:hypothetical protein